MVYESHFTVEGNDDGGVRVIRMKGERYGDRHAIGTPKFGNGSVIDQDHYIDCLAGHFLP